MLTRSRLLPFGSALAILLACAGPARADAIDGNWCAVDGRTFSIDGPTIATPGGATIRGEYDRHGFAYVIPAPEDGAGSRVAVVLLNEETVRIEAGFKPEIWHRCDVTS
jgi:hypothetical protein